MLQALVQVQELVQGPLELEPQQVLQAQELVQVQMQVQMQELALH